MQLITLTIGALSVGKLVYPYEIEQKTESRITNLNFFWSTVFAQTRVRKYNKNNNELNGKSKVNMKHLIIILKHN